MQFLKANTAVDVLIGPFLDSTDGDTEETALTISQADVLLSKNGQALAQKNDATAAAHDANGMYNCELDATDTNTEGTLVLYCHESGALAVRHEFMVLAEAAYDSLCVAKDTGYMDINIKAISDSTAAADQLEETLECGTASTIDNSGADVTTTIFKTDLTYAVDDGLNGRVCMFKGDQTAALQFQWGIITSYDGTNKEITIDRPLTTAPADNDAFVIV
jgi:hypothetical protein